MEQIMILNQKDNVGIIIKKNVGKNNKITIDSKETIDVREDIPFGFKIALMLIREGEWIVKYGETIGKATVDIKKGEMVHVHNVEGLRGRGDLP